MNISINEEPVGITANKVTHVSEEAAAATGLSLSVDSSILLVMSGL